MNLATRLLFAAILLIATNFRHKIRSASAAALVNETKNMTPIIVHSLGSGYLKNGTATQAVLLRETAAIARGKLSFASTLQRAARKALKGGLSGAIAGAVQVVSLMWLRTTVNYQYRYGVTMIQAMKDLYKQGGIMRFYRGILYAIIQGPLARFGAVAANDASVVIVAYLLGQSEKSSTGAFATALGSVLAGVWRIILMPIDTCKTVLQVDGARGFRQLMHSVYKGNFMALFNGATATLVATMVGYYPWFYVFNILDRQLPTVPDQSRSLLRSAIIGFIATTCSDAISNSVRVVKTVKQASGGDVGCRHSSYLSIVRKVYAEGGVKGLFGRGLVTRILTNGIQSMLFTVIWKYLTTMKSETKREVNADVDVDAAVRKNAADEDAQ